VSNRERTNRVGGRQARRPRFVGYVRVSRVGDRGDKLRSPEQQEAAIRAFARAERLELVEVVVEVDVSGAKAKRSGLAPLVDRVEAGELEGIVVAKLDRLSRLAPRERLDLLERVGNDRLLSATESNDVATPEGRFVREIFFSLARMEWERARDNLALAKRNAIAGGIYLSTVAPFGYRFDEAHRLVVDELEAAIVVELFRLRATGAAWSAVLELFEQRTGRRSSRATVSAMLRNRAYLGHVVYGRSAETRLENLDAHPAIVDVDLWDEVQATNVERSGNGRLGGWSGRATSLLAGIAECSCGAGTGRTTSNGGANGYYRCTDPACPARATIGEEALDDYVRAEVLAWAGPVADEAIEIPAEGGGRAAAEARVAEATASRLAWAADVERELADPEGYRVGLEARDRLVERRELELAELGEADVLEAARATVRQALSGELELDVDEERRLLKSVLAAVVIRRTPRRGAPASERARLVFRSAGPASPEDSLELLEQSAA